MQYKSYNLSNPEEYAAFTRWPSAVTPEPKKPSRFASTKALWEGKQSKENQVPPPQATPTGTTATATTATATTATATTATATKQSEAVDMLKQAFIKLENVRRTLDSGCEEIKKIQKEFGETKAVLEQALTKLAAVNNAFDNGCEEMLKLQTEFSKAENQVLIAAKRLGVQNPLV